MWRKQVEDTLTRCGLEWDRHKVNQILGTAAVESDFFKHSRQLGGGTALGYFQCEPATRQDIINNYLKYRPNLKRGIRKALGPLKVKDDTFVANVPMQIVFCYLQYERYNGWASCLKGYANTWKIVYNTIKGKGTPEDFIAKYERYCK